MYWGSLINLSRLSTPTAIEGGTLEDLRFPLRDARSIEKIMEVFPDQRWSNLVMIQELYLMRNRADKDILAALCCGNKRFMRRHGFALGDYFRQRLRHS